MGYYETIIEKLTSKANEYDNENENNRSTLEAKKEELKSLKIEAEETTKEGDYKKYVDLFGKIQMCETMIQQLENQSEKKVEPSFVHNLLNDVRKHTNETLSSKYKELQMIITDMVSCIDEIEGIYHCSMVTNEQIERFGDEYSVIPEQISLGNTRSCSKGISDLEGFKGVEIKKLKKYVDSRI